MPIKYGQYISKKNLETDKIFLEEQSLSKDQVEVVQDYLCRRLAKNTGSVSTIMLIGFLVILLAPIVWEIADSILHLKSISAE